MVRPITDRAISTRTTGPPSLINSIVLFSYQMPNSYWFYNFAFYTTTNGLTSEYAVSVRDRRIVALTLAKKSIKSAQDWDFVRDGISADVVERATQQTRQANLGGSWASSGQEIPMGEQNLSMHWVPGQIVRHGQGWSRRPVAWIQP